MTQPTPTPTPLASTAMAAAREITPRAEQRPPYELMDETKWMARVISTAKILERHFNAICAERVSGAEQSERFLNYAEKQLPVTDDGIAMLALAGEIRYLRSEVAHFQPLLAKVEAHTSTLNERIECDAQEIGTLMQENTALRADLAAAKEERDEAVALEKKYAEIFEASDARLRTDLAAKEAAMAQIFKWWDAGDGHLITHFGHAVSKKMESFRSALASRADKGGAT